MTPEIKHALDKLREGIIFTLNTDKVFYLARIDDEGRVLIPVEDGANEFKALGTTDTMNSYVYIRHMDSGSIFMEEVLEGRTMSCVSRKYNVRYELRLVAGVKNADSYVLENALRRVIATTTVYPTNEMKNIKLVPRKSTIDSITVMKEESPKPKQFDKNLIFVAIDFDLTFEMNYLN